MSDLTEEQMEARIAAFGFDRPEEYTPTTDEMRFAWAARVDKHNQEGSDEFERWLAAHSRGVAARAWDEGVNTGIGYKTAMDVLGAGAPEPTNPYREVSDRGGA